MMPEPNQQQKEILSKRVKRILKDAGNKKCSECRSEKPKWMALQTTNGGAGDERSYGVFCCDKCFQHFLPLVGKGCCQLKSLKAPEEWTEFDVLTLEKSGNTAVNAIYEANLQGNHSEQEKGALSNSPSFVAMKYQEGIFFCSKTYKLRMRICEWELAQGRSQGSGSESLTTKDLVAKALHRQGSMLALTKGSSRGSYPRHEEKESIDNTERRRRRRRSPRQNQEVSSHDLRQSIRRGFSVRDLNTDRRISTRSRKLESERVLSHWSRPQSHLRRSTSLHGSSPTRNRRGHESRHLAHQQHLQRRKSSTELLDFHRALTRHDKDRRVGGSQVGKPQLRRSRSSPDESHAPMSRGISGGERQLGKVGKPQLRRSKSSPYESHAPISRGISGGEQQLGRSRSSSNEFIRPKPRYSFDHKSKRRNQVHPGTSPFEDSFVLSSDQGPKETLRDGSSGLSLFLSGLSLFQEQSKSGSEDHSSLNDISSEIAVADSLARDSTAQFSTGSSKKLCDGAEADNARFSADQSKSMDSGILSMPFPPVA